MLAVLMYHSVSAVDDGPLRALAVPRQQLAEQLGALAGAGYALLGLTEALRRRQADLAAPIVAVTFDDAFVDFVTSGLDVLAEVGSRATMYVPAGHIGRDADWLGARSAQFDRLMTWDEVREIAAAGVEIGNHAMIHEPLDVLARERLGVQIRDSRDLLENEIQAPVRSFAYPHGYHSRAVRDLVERTGHETACEVGHRLHDDSERRYAIPRLQVTPDHSGADLVDLVRNNRPRLMPFVKDLARPGWRAVRWAAQRGFGRRLT